MYTLKSSDPDTTYYKGRWQLIPVIIIRYDKYLIILAHETARLEGDPVRVRVMLSVDEDLSGFALMKVKQRWRAVTVHGKQLTTHTIEAHRHCTSIVIRSQRILKILHHSVWVWVGCVSVCEL